LGRVQQVAGEYNQAVTSFGKMAGLQALSPKPLLRLADAHMANKNKDGAVQALKKALDVKPDSLEAQRGLVMLDVDAKKYPEAIAMARSVQKQRPKEAVGYVLEGDVNAVQKNWDGAVAAYRLGLKEAPSSELALKVYSSLMAGTKTADAERFAVSWIKDHPNDSVFQFFRGDDAIIRKDYVAAEKAYAAVVKIQPGNAAAYNNLAWVTGRLNKPGAIEFAQKSLQLAPNQAAFMDTLAMLYSDKGDYAKALEWQDKAIAALPENKLFKLNLAKIHVKGGKKDLARKELEGLVKLGDKFGGQAEVTGLLKSL
jgi:putative PEP-CTERM system TPR-repeat lipoprotein